MQNQSNYWSAWMAGWVSATKMMLEAQQRTLEMFLPRSGRPGVERAFEMVESAMPATAGDKPAGRSGRRQGSAQKTPRRRGRPRKSQSAEQHAPRRRGRPPKQAKAQAPRRRGRPPKSARA
jgi:hypothetical protein